MSTSRHLPILSSRILSSSSFASSSTTSSSSSSASITTSSASIVHHRRGRTIPPNPLYSHGLRTPSSTHHQAPPSSSAHRWLHTSVSCALGKKQGDQAVLTRGDAANWKGKVVEGNQEQDPGLRMLIFGKPGSGKGTLSARLVQKYDLHFISTGDVLRREILQKSEIGREAEEVVKNGGLVGDDLMLRIIEGELDKLHGKSWILDGFPRTLHQAGLLDDALNRQGRPLNMIIHLRVPDSVILQRISARWVHLPSGRTYSTVFNAPKVPGKDDVTGEPLTQRPDDTPEVFNKRLSAFYKSTSPLLTYFQSYHSEEYHEIAGTTSDEVRFARSFRYDAPDGDSNVVGSRLSSSSTPPRTMSPMNDDYDSTTTTLPSTSSGNVEKIWPHLEALVDRYQEDLRRNDDEDGDGGGVGGLGRGSKARAAEVEEVRREADDLRDPDEPVKRVV